MRIQTEGDLHNEQEYDCPCPSVSSVVKNMLLIGLMSGTSADGIDAALVEIEGEGRSTHVTLGHFVSVPYERAMRDAILELCDPQTGTVPDLCALNFSLGERFAEAALCLLEGAKVETSQLSAIASHGQTVWHQPTAMECGGIAVKGTLQIGAPAVIAARTGCRVISDFRSADMAVGGQGAPLVPYFDWVVLGSDVESRAVLNLGGIANITYLPAGGGLDAVIAFDTGPANMLIDGLTAHYSGADKLCDRDGALAAQGRWAPKLGDELLRNPYFCQEPPKTTGRESFGQDLVRHIAEQAEKQRLSQADVLATVTDLTARTVADAIQKWLPAVDRVIVGGGGCHNRTLMRMLAERLQPAAISTHDEFSIPGDAKEAMAFALLGYETLHGRPSNVPSATGASRSVVLGSITPWP